LSALHDRVIGPAGRPAAGHRLGRYEVLAKLASGGMAVVYVARAQGAADFERLVALKVLHANLAYEEEFTRMFLDEARLAASIRHPNVVPTIDISDSLETGYFLVMEYIEGDHLGALLASAHKAGERLSLPIILRIAADALAGLGAAHELRDETGKSLHLVHRDVSPHNILVGRDGVSRLTDFGVAKAEDRLTHTRDGQVKGKLAYMAPEQASIGSSDSRSDLFSMGIILWECVTTRRLFRAESTAATLTKLLSEEIALPSAVDPALAPLDSVLRKALERDPGARFQTAEEFIEAIELAARGVGGLASRRAVSKAVKQYAAEKLARDRKLIAAAKRGSRGGAPPPGVGLVDLTAPTADASMPTSSLSRSKPSGVFSNLTAPGLLRRGRSQRPAVARSEEIPARDVLAPPPPLGGVALLQVPSAPEIATAAASTRSWRPQFLLVILVLVCTAALASSWLGSSGPDLAPARLRVALSRVQSKIAPPPKATEAQLPSETARAAPPLPAAPTSTMVGTRGVTRPSPGAARNQPIHAPRHAEEQQPEDVGAPNVRSPQDLLPNPYKE
jgi:serine/threonine protein kinase